MNPRQFFEQQARAAKRREWEQQLSNDQPAEVRRSRAYRFLGRGLGADFAHLDEVGALDDRRRRMIVEHARAATDPDQHDGDTHPRALVDQAVAILGWDDLPA